MESYSKTEQMKSGWNVVLSLCNEAQRLRVSTQTGAGCRSQLLEYLKTPSHWWGAGLFLP